MHEPLRGNDRAVSAALLATSIAMALPVLVFRGAPFADLADHEMVLAGLAKFGDEIAFPRAIYALQLGGANQLLLAFGVPLTRIAGAVVATRILVAAMVAAFPWAVAHAARSLDRSRLTAVVLAPLALGAPLRWGLFAYLLGCMLFLFAVRPLLAVVRAPTIRRVAAAAAWLVVATLAHGSAVVVAAIFVVPWLLQRLRAPRGLVPLGAVGAVLALPVALLLLQVRMFEGNARPELRAFLTVEHPRLDRLAMLPNNLLGPFEGPVAAGLCVLAGCVLAVFWKRGPRGNATALQLVGAALMLAQYVIWPYGHDGAGLLYLRFLLPGAVLLGIAVAPKRHAPGKALFALAALVPVAMTLALLPLYASSSALYEAVDDLARDVAPGSAIASIDFRASPLAAQTLLARPAAHLIALRGGRTWGFSDMPQYPLQIRAEASWLPSGIRLRNPRNFIPDLDMRRYRYVLVGLEGALSLPHLTEALGPCARLVTYADPFALYESSCAEPNLATREPPLPAHFPPTLGQLLGRAGPEY